MPALRAHLQRRRLSDEDGFTLVEQLVTVVLMGIGVVAVLGAVLTLVATSITHRNLSDGAYVLSSSGEQLISRETQLQSCTAGTSAPQLTVMENEYSKAAQPLAPVPGMTVAVESVQFWNGATFDGICHEAAGLRAQKLTLRVKAGTTNETLELVKWS